MRLVYEDDPKFGGITDFGDFSEGSCAKTITRESGKIVWIVCFENLSLKKNYIEMLRSLKIDEQHEDGILAMKHQDKSAADKNTIQGLLNPNNNKKKDNSPQMVRDKNGNLVASFDSKDNQSLTDGYWIVIQEWTQCSLKCGGGTSTLQRMCVPPKHGGKNCEGKDIITKTCNTNPCPRVFKTDEFKNNTSVNKAIIKSMAFSNKPQRYVKCKIKEADLMLFQNVTDPLFKRNPIFAGQDMQGQNSISVPIRVVMNNSTLTLYTGDETESLYLSFNLVISRFVRSGQKGCFEVYESNKKYATLCPFGCDDSNKALEEWDYDFNLFKYQCNYKRANIDEDEMMKKLAEKMVRKNLLY